MSSTSSAIPPSHVPSASLQNHHHAEEHRQDDIIVDVESEWPALSSPVSTSKPTVGSTMMQQQQLEQTTEEWELLHPEQPATTTLDAGTSPSSVVRIVEPTPNELQSMSSTANSGTTSNSKKNLKHCQSSPDLRKYCVLKEEEDDDASCSSGSGSSVSSYSSSSGVMVQQPAVDDDVTTTSSSIVLVVPPEPTTTATASKTISSPWGNSKVSFRDAVMKQAEEEGETKPQHEHRHHHHHHRRHHHHSHPKKKFQTKFVVVEPPKPMRRNVRSTGDLMDMNSDLLFQDPSTSSLSSNHHDYAITGETDAPLYYNQKAQGELGRINGRKQRPDEAKRLEMIMTKKNAQRLRTLAAQGRLPPKEEDDDDNDRNW